MWLSNILQIWQCIIVVIVFQHRERPYCNGCYQRLFGPDGYRPGSIEPRKVLRKAESGDISAAERSVLYYTNGYYSETSLKLDHPKHQVPSGKTLYIISLPLTYMYVYSFKATTS